LNQTTGFAALSFRIFCCALAICCDFLSASNAFFAISALRLSEAILACARFNGFLGELANSKYLMQVFNLEMLALKQRTAHMLTY
jgi:hypothetical protein